MNHPRVIIIHTTPFNKNTSSRSMDSYFHFWDKDKARQIFSRNWKPQKSFCGELFQITDSELLKRWLHRTKSIGRVYHYENLENSGVSKAIEEGDVISKTYQIGRSHTPTIELLRGLLWREKYWCSAELLKWLDDYKPELVFYNFTNNLFLQRIAIFIADRYDIPIITAVGDDYYFNDIKSLSPAYLLFRKKYKQLVRRVFAHKGSAVYACDKIRDKYNAEFGLNGETIYFSSEVERKEFAPINKDNPCIVYFGNIRLGRYRVLLSIADALGKIDSSYKLEVYSNEQDEEYTHGLKSHSNVLWMGAIPYAEVQKKTTGCDIYVAAEGFRDEDISFTRYSLSTKAADGLSSGTAVFAVGPEESGLIDYLIKTNAAMVCTNEETIESHLMDLISNVELQKRLYKKAKDVTARNHTLEGSTAVFIEVVQRALA